MKEEQEFALLIQEPPHTPELPAAPSAQQVQDWYNASIQAYGAKELTRPKPAPRHPDGVSVTKLATGAGIIAGGAGVVYVGIKAVEAIAVAVVEFIEANALLIGGVVVGVFVLLIFMARRSESRHNQNSRQAGGEGAININIYVAVNGGSVKVEKD